MMKIDVRFVATFCISGVILWLPVGAGCGPAQMGRIAQARFSATGDVLAYSDVSGSAVYVADRSSSRVLEDISDAYGGFFLTPDARWVFSYATSGRGDKHVDFWLYDLATGLARHGFFPAEVRSQRPLAYVRRETDQSRTHAPPAIQFDDGPVWVLVDDGSAVYLGPIDSSFFWAWTAGGVQPHARVSRQDFAVILSSVTSARRIKHDEFENADSSEFLVELPFDGWNARRSVWVRPDGSVLELTRMNTLPNSASAHLVATPLAILPIYGEFWLSGWASIIDVLTYDAAANRQAKRVLSRAIDLRRTASDPDREE